MHLGQGVRASSSTPSSSNSGPTAPWPSASACWPARYVAWVVSLGGPHSGVRGTLPTPPRRAPGCLSGRALEGLDTKDLRKITTDPVQVKAERAQQLGVAGPRAGHQPTLGQTTKRGPRRPQVDPTGPQDPGGPTAAVAEQPQHKVLGPDIAVAEAIGLLPGQVEDPADRFGELIDHRSRPPEPEPSAGVLVVHGLLGDAEAGRDLLPGPALGAGVLDLQGLQHLDQAA
jgi:hypothetical protein